MNDMFEFVNSLSAFFAENSLKLTTEYNKLFSNYNLFLDIHVINIF